MDYPLSGPAARIMALQSELVTPASFDLCEEVCTIGRAPSCDIIVSHPLVSRLHARIERNGPRYILADAGSANGTYVNGRRMMEQYMLLNDDLIGLGSTGQLLRFVDADPTVPAANLLRYDDRAMRFYLGSQMVELSPLQFKLLLHLYQHAGDVCSRESCARAIWSRDYSPGMDAGALDQAVNTLRRTLRAIDPEANPIQTRRGMGYILVL